MHGIRATPPSTNQYAMKRCTPHVKTSKWLNLRAPHPQLHHCHPMIPTPILIPPSWLPRELTLPPHPWIHSSAHTPTNSYLFPDRYKWSHHIPCQSIPHARPPMSSPSLLLSLPTLTPACTQTHVSLTTLLPPITLFFINLTYGLFGR